ncbi:MAG: DUF2085 domain-containing protein [Thermoplasmata archaeon]
MSLGSQPPHERRDEAGIKRLSRGKMTRNKILLILFAITFLWSVSLFIAPMTIPSGTVTDLDGYANRVDYPKKWDSMPLYPRIVYYLGDVQCHQKWYRSFSINGNQMPVDARVTSIYVGLTMGLLTATFALQAPSILTSLMSLFPSRFRRLIREKIGYSWFIILLIATLILPLALDGALQLFTTYESTNPRRVLTGFPFGWISGLILGVMVSTISKVRREA